MDEATARALAAAEISVMQAEVDRVNDDKRAHQIPVVDVDFVITAVRRIGETWCVFYNDRRYVESGDVRDALAGNGPLLISAAGRIGRAGTALPTEHYVAEFERPSSAP